MLAMEKLFYTDLSAYDGSMPAVRKILKEYFGVENAVIERNENGKPFLKNADIPLFFSVTHTAKRLFLAFSDENVGIDAEPLSQQRNYFSILRKFPAEERAEIQNTEDFLLHWTVKESAIKWLGGSIAHDLYKLAFIQNRLTYNGLDVPVTLTTKIWDEHILTLCSERDFSTVPFIAL